MEHIPWFAWIAIVGIIAFMVVTVAGTLSGPRQQHREALTEALRSNTDAQSKTSERLDAIESRLSAIEHTLNDIP